MIPRGKMGVVLNAMSLTGSVRRMTEAFQNWEGQGMVPCLSPKGDLARLHIRCKQVACNRPPASVSGRMWS